MPRVKKYRCSCCLKASRNKTAMEYHVESDCPGADLDIVYENV